MTNQEYENAIREIAESGRGWDAIKDILRLLEAETEEQDVKIADFTAERRAIKRICNSKQVPKEKVESIKAICE